MNDPQINTENNPETKPDTTETQTPTIQGATLGQNPTSSNNDDAPPPSAEELLEALKVVKDPEIPVNVVDLGLVYRCEVSADGIVDIDMTLTSVGCPVQDMIRADAELALMRVPGVKAVNVDFIWTPPWTMAKMTEDGKRQMRMFGFSV